MLVYRFAKIVCPYATPATRANLMAELARFREAKSADVILIYLAGHGISWGGQDGDYRFLLKDALSGDLSDPVNREQWSISSSELRDAFRTSKAKKQLLVLDTCQSGQLILDMTQEREISSSQRRALDRLKDQTGTFILAGSASDGPSYEASRYGQGLLTYSLLLAMKTGIDEVLREGYVDVIGLLRFAQNQVPLLASDIGGIQSPQLAMPKGGQSFPVGRLEAEDRDRIPLASPRPLMLQSRFDRFTQPTDEFGLSRRFDEVLRAHGEDLESARFIYLDADRGTGALRIAGRYRIEARKILVRVFLLRDDRRLGDSFEVEEDFEDEADEGDWESLTQEMLDGVLVRINALGPASAEGAQ